MSTTNGAEVSVATANAYIEDFIDTYYTPGAAPVKSMIMDAQLLRNYLSNTEITNVKFVLGARTVQQNGQDVKVFTLVVAGYDSDGDYVLTTNGNILDHMEPCPNSCPTIGNAANDYIVV